MAALLDRLTLSRLLLAGFGSATALLLARSLIEPFLLVEEREEAEVPNLPPSWEGQRIALLCDIHVGLPGGNVAVTRRAVERVIQSEPAVALLAGDFVHGDHGSVARSVELVRPLVEAGIRVYAVLGNHDYAMPTKDSEIDRELAGRLARSLREAGVRVLDNEVVEMRLQHAETGAETGAQTGAATAVQQPAERPVAEPAAEPAAETLHLVGIGSHTAREDRPAELLSSLETDAPRVVLMHHPASFNDCPPHTAPFAVAGHTHGGQVRLPFTPLVRYLTYAKEIKVVVAGWVEDGVIDGYGEEGNRLYVSRGVGCSVVPMRLFCPPEVTIFTLRNTTS